MIPDGFHANILRAAFPESHTYKVALFPSHYESSTYSREDEWAGYGYLPGGKTLSGYKVNDFGSYATISFDSVIDWFDVDVKARSAVIYDADTGSVLNIMNFERQTGVMGGVFTLRLHESGVVQLGEKHE